MKNDEPLSQLEVRLGHEFDDRDLLAQALRHPSFVHENPRGGASNQRLEFLGDAVFGLVVAAELSNRYPEATEGDLTRYRAQLVKEASLAEAAMSCGIDEALILGRGEEAQGGRERASVLADAMEAVVGAVFSEAGHDKSREVILGLLGQRLETVQADDDLDHKSRLQEHVQRCGAVAAPTYEVVSTTGPDHDKQFDVVVRVAGQRAGQGTGRSKKQAEQSAAQDALALIEACPEEEP